MRILAAEPSLMSFCIPRFGELYCCGWLAHLSGVLVPELGAKIKCVGNAAALSPGRHEFEL